MADHYLAFWNVENLFGPEDHPHRIEWIAKRVANDLKGWSQALYEKKLAQLAMVITPMNAGAGPDILGVCEIEDRYVLEDLCQVLMAQLPGRNYAVVHADSEREQRGIDTAFIYDAARYTVDPNLIFNHFVIRRTGTRDVLQATFRSTSYAGRDLVLLCNHWPSRSGGAIESAGFRAAAGETLGYWHERIREETSENTAIVAFGDFNDDPWDGSLLFNANSTRERGDVERAESAVFFNLAWTYLRWEATNSQGQQRTLDGTLYHQGNGNIFDQILVNTSILRGRGGFTLVEGSAGVAAIPAMVSHKVGEGPIRFGLPKGDAAKNVNQEGFSDHFPVSVVIRESP